MLSLCGKVAVYKRLLPLTMRFFGSEFKKDDVCPKSGEQKRPVKPLNPYFSFLVEKRPQIIESNPGLKYRDVLKLVGDLWNNLPNEEKKIYNDRFEKEREEFKKLNEVWLNGLSLEEKNDLMQSKKMHNKKKLNKTYFKKLLDLGRPRRPLSAINYFVADYYKNGGQSNCNDKIIGFASIAGIWKAMKEKERKPYNEMARMDFERFSKEKLVWELKMMREGKGNLIEKLKQKVKAVSKKSVD